MACKLICDACGKEEAGIIGIEGWKKPEKWFQRPFVDRFQDACSWKCVLKLRKTDTDIEIKEGD